MKPGTEEQLLTAFRQLDDVEQVIVMANLDALADERVSVEDWRSHVGGLLGRHRRGEDIEPSELAYTP